MSPPIGVLRGWVRPTSDIKDYNQIITRIRSDLPLVFVPDKTSGYRSTSVVDCVTVDLYKLFFT